MKVFLHRCIIIGTILTPFFLTSFGFSANWLPLADTGESKCYGTEYDVVIPCPREGESFYGQDAQYQGLKSSYTDNGNGTVIDNNTKLTWQKNTADLNGDGVITDGDGYPDYGDRASWQDAKDFCSNLNLDGRAWRLPTVFELNSIVDYSSYDLMIDSIFQCESSDYWTDTVTSSLFAYIWVVSFRGANGTWSDILMGREYFRCVSD